MGLPSLVDAGLLAPGLFDVALRSVLILGATGVMVAALRRSSAAARHWVWLMGFAALLLLPLLSATIPGWHILPRFAGHDAPSAMEVPTAFGEDPMPTAAPARWATESPALEASVPKPHEAQAVAQAPPAVPAAVMAPVAAPAAAAGSRAIPWTAWVVLAWLAGSILAIGYVAMGHVSLWLLRRRSETLSQGQWPELLRQLSETLQLRRAVELLKSPLRTMPMTWGIWRSRLLLPAQAEIWPQEQRRAVLLHELGHVRRWDCLTQLFAQIACALYWFNPLVWFAWRRMQIEREAACDDLVLAAGTRASTYAHHLLQSATATPALHFVGAAIAMARPSTLEERLRAILDGQRSRRPLTPIGSLATMFLLGAVLIPVAALQGQQASAPAEVTASPPATAPARRAALEAALGGTSTMPGPASGRGARGGGVGRSGAPALMPATEGPTASLDATIYDLRLAGDQIGRLDINALAQAAGTAGDFEKALAALGTSQPLYRVNQSVRLLLDQVHTGTSTPYIASTTITSRGVVNVPNWYSTGATFQLRGKPGGGNTIDLDMEIAVSTLTDSKTAIQENVKAPLFRNVRLSHKGPVTAQQPFVILSIDAASADADGKAVAYIARITLGAPQGTMPPARGGQ